MAEDQIKLDHDWIRYENYLNDDPLCSEYENWSDVEFDPLVNGNPNLNRDLVIHYSYIFLKLTFPSIGLLISFDPFSSRSIQSDLF